MVAKSNTAKKESNPSLKVRKETIRDLNVVRGKAVVIKGGQKKGPVLNPSGG